MADYWDKFPDSTLTKLERAEKAYVIFQEQKEDMIKFQIEGMMTQARRNMNGMNDKIEEDKFNKIEAHKKEIEDIKKKSRELWLKWVLLKPYVDQKQKDGFITKHLKDFGELPKDDSEEEEKKVEEGVDSDLEQLLAEKSRIEENIELLRRKKLRKTDKD